MPTYRVMDSDGNIVDMSHEPTDVSNEEAIKWYKNMLTGTLFNRVDNATFSRQFRKVLTSYKKSTLWM